MLKFARGFAFIAVVVGLPFLAGCATGPAVSREGPAAEAPTYRVGDRWTYKARDGFGLPVIWDEVHEVTAVGPDGITMRVTQRGPSVDNARIEKLVSRLRQKLEPDPANPKYLFTVRGRGYKLVEG